MVKLYITNFGSLKHIWPAEIALVRLCTVRADITEWIDSLNICVKCSFVTLSVQWPASAMSISSNWHQTTLQSEGETVLGRHAGIVILLLYSNHATKLEETCFSVVHICRVIKTVKVLKCYFHVLEVSVINTYPTNHVVQIKMDFHCFNSPTVICHLQSRLVIACPVITGSVVNPDFLPPGEIPNGPA